MKTSIKIAIPVIILAIIGAITGAAININIENGKIGAEITYSQEEIPASIDDKGEIKETTEYNGEEIPTVEEVDGGMFEDETTGLSAGEGEYEDLGAAVETFDTSTPEAFRNTTLGKCVYANNRYGAQCVSLSRSFWWSYAGFDVSTCGALVYCPLLSFKYSSLSIFWLSLTAIINFLNAKSNGFKIILS